MHDFLTAGNGHDGCRSRPRDLEADAGATAEADAQNPALDWGNPETLPAFWSHVTGKVYHVWFLSSWDAMRS